MPTKTAKLTLSVDNENPTECAITIPHIANESHDISDQQAFLNILKWVADQIARVNEETGFGQAPRETSKIELRFIDLDLTTGKNTLTDLQKRSIHKIYKGK